MKTNASRYNTARKWLIFWTLFVGIGAVAGGLSMIIDPSGKALHMDAMLPFFQVLPFSEVLFQDFLFSGFALLIVNGLTNLTAAVLLLKNRKRINRCARATTALKPVADRYQQMEKQKDEEISRLVESGKELTEEEQQRVEERAREKEAAEQQAEYAREAQQEQVKKNNLRGAIFGIIFTILIAIWGATVYGSGRGVMTLFHSIELSPTAFAIIIAVLIVWDIISLVKAVKERNR